ncbi:MAG: integrase catalytic domain-containing protein [Bifidobacterium pullorum]|uniref:integrase catalytic domain-containing protein n=1 Tax=Bifidobacterium pullorum TaxID=78448 RepID=UPI0039918B4E
MATKHQITLRFRDEYAKASKKDKGVILDRMCETLGIGRSTARRRLAAASREGSAERRRAERPCRYSDRSRQLLREVWMLMDMPCGKYLKAMLPQWLPVLRACGELDDYGGDVFDELMAMSAATVDRYLRPVRDAARPRGLASTRPAGELLRNSITIRKASDELDGLPGDVEADTVAHCGPSLRGEFCRTLTVVDFATGWTENASARNNAYRNLSLAEAVIEERLPFRIRSYDSDNGSEFINADFIAHLQAIDVEQTRSRPYRKNDQATVESRNNHVVRRHAFYYRYEPPELDLLNELWSSSRSR